MQEAVVHPLFEQLAGKECQYDSDCTGVLDRRTYKGDDALVCTECGTPAVRRW